MVRRGVLMIAPPAYAGGSLPAYAGPLTTHHSPLTTGDQVVDTIPQREGDRFSLYEWKTRASEPGTLLLFRDGVQIGGWNVSARLYLAYDARSNSWAHMPLCDGHGCRLAPAWQDCAPAPVPQGAGARTQESGVRPSAEQKPTEAPSPAGAGEPPLTGVDPVKLAAYGKGNTRRGRKISRDEAFEAIEAKTLPDDGNCLRLCCIGPDCHPDRLKADLAGVLGTVAGQITVQCYGSSDDPMLKDLGFYSSGIHVLDPKGEPLWWCAQYADPADLKAGIELAQARRKDPNWDPRQWPKLAEPAAAPAPTPAPAPAPAPTPAPSPAPDVAPVNWNKLIVGLLSALLALLLHSKYPLLNKLAALARSLLTAKPAEDPQVAALKARLAELEKQRQDYPPPAVSQS
jgi:hypothetical protein